MKTHLCLKPRVFALLLTLLLLFAACAAAYDLPQYGTLNQRMATRIGPGTQFAEPGTFYSAGRDIPVYSIAYDVNDVAWVQTEINTAEGKMRVYTGCKRVDGLNISLLPVEGEEPFTGTMLYDYTPKYGPGPYYASCDFTIRAGRSFTIRLTEGDWAMVEYYAKGDGQWVHFWLPMMYMTF